MPEIKALILDVGGVLIHYNNEKIIQNLSKYSLIGRLRNDWQVTAKILWPITQQLYATGQISSYDFYTKINDLLKLRMISEYSKKPEPVSKPVSEREFWEIWNDADFKINNEFCYILEKLIKTTHFSSRNIHILSNVNEKHWEYWQKNFFRLDQRIEKIVKGLYLPSYQLGRRKLDFEILSKAFDKIFMSPAYDHYYLWYYKHKDCLFIDDKLENVEAARELGWNALVYPDELHKLNEYFDADIVPID